MKKALARQMALVEGSRAFVPMEAPEAVAEFIKGFVERVMS